MVLGSSVGLDMVVILVFLCFFSNFLPLLDVIWIVTSMKSKTLGWRASGQSQVALDGQMLFGVYDMKHFR
jgi:hypothetical protein